MCSAAGAGFGRAGARAGIRRGVATWGIRAVSVNPAKRLREVPAKNRRIPSRNRVRFIDPAKWLREVPAKTGEFPVGIVCGSSITIRAGMRVNRDEGGC